MIAKCTAGSGFHGALKYDLGLNKNGQPRGQWVAGSLIGSSREMSAQAAHFRALRPDCIKAVFRISLSANPEYGFLAEKKWVQIAEDFLGELQIDPKSHAWVAIRHQDNNKDGRPHDHIHISVVRVNAAGVLWNQEFSARRAIKASKILEQKHGLQTHSRELPDRRRPQIGEQKLKFRRGNKEMPREKIVAAIDQILAEHSQGFDTKDFKSRLAEQGVILRSSMTQAGRLQGFSFKCDGVAFPGSKLGAGYGLPGLLQRGVRAPAVESAEKTERLNIIESEKLTFLSEQKEVDKKEKRKEKEDQPSQIFGLVSASPIPSQAAHKIIQHNGIGQLSKALSLLGSSINQFAIERLSRFVEWIKEKLKVWFGIDLQSSFSTDANRKRQVTLQPQVIDVESHFVPPTLSLEKWAENASDWVNGVTEQVKNGTFEFNSDLLSGAPAASIAIEAAPAIAAHLQPEKAKEDGPKPKIQHLLTSQVSATEAPIERLQKDVDAWKAANLLKSQVFPLQNLHFIQAAETELVNLVRQPKAAIDQQGLAARVQIEVLDVKVKKSNERIRCESELFRVEAGALAKVATVGAAMQASAKAMRAAAPALRDDALKYPVLPDQQNNLDAISEFGVAVKNFLGEWEKHPAPDPESVEAVDGHGQQDQDWQDPDGAQAPSG